MASSMQLEKRAERARERLSNRLEDLRYHVSPATVVSDLFGVTPSTLGKDLLPVLTQQARSNPIALALIATGIGWLIFSEVSGPLGKIAFGQRRARQTERRQTRKRGKRRRSSARTREK